MADRGGEHVKVFARLRERLGGKRSARIGLDSSPGQRPFDPGRDPNSVGFALTNLIRDRGWEQDLSRSELFIAWAEAVGPAVADHARPIELVDGVLVVKCDSTAWATQLGLMRSTVLTSIVNRFPDAGVDSIRLLGPDVPTYKRGPKSVPGRGPRDTYG